MLWIYNELPLMAAADVNRASDLLPLLPPVFVVGMWLFMGFIFSRAGWEAFAKAYGIKERPAGPRFSAPHAVFGGVGYKNVVRAVACDQGLWFHCLFLFRMFHPPFLLPWQSVVEVRRLDGFFIHGWQLRVHDAVGGFGVRFNRDFRTVLEKYRPDLVPLN